MAFTLFRIVYGFTYFRGKRHCICDMLRYISNSVAHLFPKFVPIRFGQVRGKAKNGAGRRDNKDPIDCYCPSEFGHDQPL